MAPAPPESAPAEGNGSSQPKAVSGSGSPRRRCRATSMGTARAPFDGARVVEVDFRGDGRQAWQVETGRAACAPVGTLTRRVAIALVAALLGQLAFVALRFRWTYGGAAVAMFHHVVILLAICRLARQDG
jgi:hypothetical protein